MASLLNGTAEQLVATILAFRELDEAAAPLPARLMTSFDLADGL